LQYQYWNFPIIILATITSVWGASPAELRHNQLFIWVFMELMELRAAASQSEMLNIVVIES
jgi:hypothetical protein